MGQEMRAKGKQRFQLGTSSENHAENLPKRFTAQGSWGLCYVLGIICFQDNGASHCCVKSPTALLWNVPCSKMNPKYLL